MAFELDIKVRPSNLDETGHVSLHSFFVWYNEIAMRHDESEGYSWRKNQEMGFSWILYRWKSIFFRRVEADERLRLKTWVSKMDSFMIYREFELMDEEGQAVVHAICVCSAMNVAERMLIRIPKVFRETYPVEEKTHFSNLPKMTEFLTSPSDFGERFPILYQDIDFNNHVNNLVYIRWVWDLLPIVYRREKRMTEFDIVYRREIRDQSHICLDAVSFEESGERLGAKIRSEDSETVYASISLKFATEN